MNNGCICCTVRGDLIRILEGLMKRKDKFDGILIETTGLADPGPVAQTFFTDDEIKARTRLDAIVTVVDAKHFLGQLEEGDEAEEQVAFADVILLNKTDLVSADELTKVEGKIQLDQPLRPHLQDAEEPDRARRHPRQGRVRPEAHPRVRTRLPRITATITTTRRRSRACRFTADRPVDPDKFQKWMGALLQLRGPDIFRSKGILAIDGAPRALRLPGRAHDDGLPTGARRGRTARSASSKLVFIGRNLDGENLKRGFEDCLK